MAPIPQKGKACSVRKAAYKRHKQAAVERKRAVRKDRKHVELQSQTEQSSTSQTDDCSSSQFVKDHTLSGKKSAMHIIVKAVNITFALVKHCLGTYPITVINCDVALVDALIASLEKESPAEMRTVHMQMNRVWDQPGGVVGLDMSFGFDVICLWILHREQPKPEWTFELDLDDADLSDDFKHLVQRLRVSLAKA